jgi:hypothetical protein
MYNGGAPKPQMTCVGLLGLALGHGALLGDSRERKGAKIADDPAIKRGLDALSKEVGTPTPGATIPNANLYYLWSLERVAMLYNLETINGKDWYGWGANHLLASQQRSGAWEKGNYPGSSPALDTSFALLFLHRSNLVQDLTDQLNLQIPLEK